MHGDSVRQQLEDIHKQHADGLDVLRRVHKEELAKINADRQDAIKPFDALTKSSTDLEKQLRVEIANANTRTERLQLSVKDATAKIIGKFLNFECLFCFILSLF